MIDTCTPRTTLECWQYTKNQEEVPLWALPFLSAQDTGEIEFVYPNNGGQAKLGEGEWLVRLRDSEVDTVEVYSADDFKRNFNLTPRVEAR